MRRAGTNRRHQTAGDNSTSKSKKRVEKEHNKIHDSKSFGCCFDTIIKNTTMSLSSNVATFTAALFYVLSGVTQPLLMTVAKNVGLADSSCQLYMFFYYMGPASVTFSLLQSNKQDDGNGCCCCCLLDWPWNYKPLLYKTIAIALFDLIAQMMNYTGAAYAGPTIFAIIYSSVTVWTAVFSFLFLKRTMSLWQWLGVLVVFAGLAITAIDSVELGTNVRFGCTLVIIGSMMHASVYVLSEAVMTIVGTSPNERVSVQQNASIQGTSAGMMFLLWQFVYTIPRFDEKIWQPMQTAQTSIVLAIVVLLSFTFANLIHSLTYFYTLKHCPGGATSAGVMKGLQAVLVFVFTHWIFCGTASGGQEMCFTITKFISLLTVVTGLIVYGMATEQSSRNQHGSVGPKYGYTKIISSSDDNNDVNDEDMTTTTNNDAKNREESNLPTNDAV